MRINPRKIPLQKIILRLLKCHYYRIFDSLGGICFHFQPINCTLKMCWNNMLIVKWIACGVKAYFYFLFLVYIPINHSVWGRYSRIEEQMGLEGLNLQYHNRLLQVYFSSAILGFWLRFRFPFEKVNFCKSSLFHAELTTK